MGHPVGRIPSRPLLATPHAPHEWFGRQVRTGEPGHSDRVDISELTPETLLTLRSSRPYPAVTMVLPVDPKAPFSEKDRIVLRGLCTEAQRQLAEDAGVERDVRLALRDGKLSPEAIAELVDPGVPGGELVVYVSASEPTLVWQVPTDAEVLPRVEFADRYLTRYLAAAEQRSW